MACGGQTKERKSTRQNSVREFIARMLHCSILRIDDASIHPSIHPPSIYPSIPRFPFYLPDHAERDVATPTPTPSPTSAHLHTEPPPARSFAPPPIPSSRLRHVSDAHCIRLYFIVLLHFRDQIIGEHAFLLPLFRVDFAAIENLHEKIVVFANFRDKLDFFNQCLHYRFPK